VNYALKAVRFSDYSMHRRYDSDKIASIQTIRALILLSPREVIYLLTCLDAIRRNGTAMRNEMVILETAATRPSSYIHYR